MYYSENVFKTKILKINCHADKNHFYIKHDLKLAKHFKTVCPRAFKIALVGMVYVSLSVCAWSDEGDVPCAC